MFREEARIVVVDDVADAAESIASALMLDGYSVKIALDGQSALAVVEEYRPHCVLLDINMPGIDGHELAKLLRARYGDEVVLIAVTGWGHEDERVSAAFASVDHCLRKPVNPEMLRELFPPIAN